MLARHTNRANVLYCDGHSKSVTLEGLAAQKKADGTLTAFTIEDD